MINLECNYNNLNPRENPLTWVYSYLTQMALSSNIKMYQTNYSGKLTNSTKKEAIEFFEKLIGGTTLFNEISSSEEKIQILNLNLHTVVDLEIGKKRRAESSVNIWTYTANQEILKEVLKWGRDHLSPKTGNTVYTVGQSNRGFNLQDLGKMNDIWQKNNYCPEIIKKALYCIDQINSTDPNGRLTIINGEPGTGKTHLIKGMIPMIKNSLIILLPTKLVTEVDGPALAYMLAEWKDLYGYDDCGEPYNPAIVFIVEDADDCLTVRNDFNMSSVSSMLNNTDGIFGSLLDLRIITTTNAHQIEFDKAFTRPGRLCAHITIEKLEPEHASKIYKRLTDKEKTYKEPVTLAQVYADANNNPHGYVKEEKKVGFT